MANDQKYAPRGGGASKASSASEDFSPRSRILATADKLFYRDGIRSVGIDTIIAASGVAKASFYRAFESKDVLIEAFIKVRDQSYWNWWDGVVAKHPNNPRDLMHALLMGIADQISKPNFRGCPFLNTATELRDRDHPGKTIARKNKEKLRSRLEAICADIGSGDPKKTSIQLLLLIDGLYVSAPVMSPSEFGSEFLYTANLVLEQSIASGVKKGRRPRIVR